MMIAELLSILPGSYTITSTRSMPGQRLCNSWPRHWLSKQHACQSAQQATSGSVPVFTRSWSGCWMMQRSGTNWRAIWNALVVIVQNVTTEINSTPVALVISSDLVIHTAAALQHVCAPCLAKPDAQKKHKMTERSHWRRQPASNENFEQTLKCHERKVSQQVLSHMCEPACLVSSERT